MRIRFFGSSNCKDCLEVFVILSKFDVDFEYIDVFDDETQELCDEQEVDELPHLQFIENDKIIIEHIGPVSEKEFEEILLEYFPTYW